MSSVEWGSDGATADLPDQDDEELEVGEYESACSWDGWLPRTGKRTMTSSVCSLWN